MRIINQNFETVINQCLTPKNNDSLIVPPDLLEERKLFPPFFYIRTHL